VTLQIVIDGFLCLFVAAAWLGAVGFLRLRAPLDRIHAVTFVNAAAGAALAIAAFLADGPTDRAFKILFIAIINLFAGAAISHMTGRALTKREG
jgi:multicomponent Na+:H+ antiporter subunit G